MIRWTVTGIAALFVLLFAETVGFFVQPWSPWWVTSQRSQTITTGELNVTIPNVPVSEGPVAIVGPIAAGTVSDVERFALALGAGFTHDQAIIATAISIAEDGSGSPSIQSPRNSNGTFDLGLWQINSNWWPQFGGHDALTDPATNAHAAVAIFGRQGWCAWSTFESSCGQGHNSAYRAYLPCAQAIAVGRACQH